MRKMEFPEREKVRSYSNTEPKEILDHFGIRQEEMHECSTFIPMNRNFAKENIGIVIAEKHLGLRKARIIIDYDADFEFIVMRIISL